MANPEHVEVVRQGTAAIDEWQARDPKASLDLSGADFSRVNLSGANLTGAKLGNANLAGTRLVTAHLIWARLAKADLTGANLMGADFFLADLTGANLAGADLFAANLSLANLDETNLTGARFGLTSLGACDLSQAMGLAAVDHQWPSSIGVDTLVRSFRGAGNKLTPDLEAFFLGAGVPRELLAELPRIVAEVKYYSCFIAYGQPDLDFAKKLHDHLVASGVPCWIYDLDKTPGEPTWGEIGRKRREADKMVVTCSAKALIRPGVLKEIEEQIDEDPDKMVPISRDNLWREPGFQVMRAGRDLKPFLLDKNYADFSDDSRHEESLQRLLKALRRKAE